MWTLHCIYFYAQIVTAEPPGSLIGRKRGVRSDDVVGIRSDTERPIIIRALTLLGERAAPPAPQRAKRVNQFKTRLGR